MSLDNFEVAFELLTVDKSENMTRYLRPSYSLETSKWVNEESIFDIDEYEPVLCGDDGFSFTKN